MNHYLRAAAYMSANVAARRFIRLTSMVSYLPQHKGLMISHEPPSHFKAEHDPEQAKFRAEVASFTWASRHSESAQRCMALMSKHTVLAAQQATKASTLLFLARKTTDAMTALELRTQARDAITVGHEHRGRVSLVGEELTSHPRPGSIPQVKRAYTRRDA